MPPSHFFTFLCEILAHRLWPLMPHSQLREDTLLLPRIAACKVLKNAYSASPHDSWLLTQIWGWTSFTFLIDCSHDMRSISYPFWEWSDQTWPKQRSASSRSAARCLDLTLDLFVIQRVTWDHPSSNILSKSLKWLDHLQVLEWVNKHNK